MKVSSTDYSEKKYKTYYNKKQLQLFSDIAKKHGVDESKVRQIMLAYGNFIEKIMKEGEESVFVPNFGKFISKKDYIANLNSNKKDTEENVTED